MAMEMVAKISDAILINLSYTVLYILLPLFLYQLIKYRRGYLQPPPSLTTIAAATMCSQAIIGTIWSSSTQERFHFYEPIVFLVFFILLLQVFFISQKSDDSWPTRKPSNYSIYLIAIVGGGVILRLMDPLQQNALGQSDAYTHLFFIRQILETGNITNVNYPPGYHWIAALPGILFPLDPYLIARYGGAFFGILLILAIWEFASTLQCKSSALFSAFLVACFPGSILLMKTGVGAYPNQFGLLLMPVILLQYFKTERTIRNLIILGLLFAGLILSVPLMSLNLIILITADLIIKSTVGSIQISLKRGIVFLSFLLVFLFSLSFLIYSHQEFFLSSVGIISQTYRPESILSGIQTLLFDFFTIKRIGFGILAFDVAVIGLAIFIITCMISTIYNQKRPFTLIAFWSLLALVQTTTGVFQFSAYQRAGWELLITLCLLGGYAYWLVIEKYQAMKQIRYLIWLSLLVSMFFSFQNFPHHIPTISKSENSLISLIWFLGRQSSKISNIPPFSFEDPYQEAFQTLIHDPPQTVITRQFSNFTYGDPIKALLSNSSELRHIPIGLESNLPSLERTGATLVILDSCFHENDSQHTATTQSLQPDQLERFLKARNTVCSINNTLQNWITGLNHDIWDIIETDYQNTKILSVKKRSIQ